MGQHLPPLHIKDLLLTAACHPGFPLIGRKRELNELARILKRVQNNNVIIVGQGGVGKTILIQGLAEALTKRHFSALRPLPFLQWKQEEFISRLNADNGSALLEHAHNALATLPASTLVIDDADTLLRTLSETDSFPKLFEIFLAKADHSLILTCSVPAWTEYQKSLARWLKSFEVLTLEEPSPKTCQQILLKRAPIIAGQYGVQLEDAVPESIYQASRQLSTDRAQPERALTFFSDTCASVTLQGRSKVTLDDVSQLIAQKTGAPSPQLNNAGRERLSNLPHTLNTQVLGQKHIINLVARIIQRGWLGLKNPHRPIGSFLFLGPSGVGKTELAKVVAKEVYGSPEAFLRIDMSEYGEAHNVQRLLGAPPGYVGYEAGGQLTNPIKKRPFSLILLDEIEKADPSVFDIFLQVLDDGRLTDGQGMTVDFSKTIIMATSNIGIENITTSWQRGDDVTNSQWLQKNLMPQLTSRFRLEFLNRFEGMAIFKPLSPDDLLAIARLELTKMEQRLAHHHIRLNVSTEFLQQQVIQCADPRFGARPIKRLIEEVVENQLAQTLLTTK